MVIIFDLDGTVLDTYQIIRKSFIQVFEKCLPNHKYTEVELESYFGPPLYNSFMSVVNDDILTHHLIIEYRKFSMENHKDLKAFPNVKECLEILKNKGYKLAIFSNKITPVIKTGLNITNLEEFFDYIVGSDLVTKTKPDPEGIRLIQNHFEDDEYIFVGDSEGDVLAAKNANIKFVGVTWALTSRNTFLKWKADYIVDNFYDLIKILEERNV